MRRNLGNAPENVKIQANKSLRRSHVDCNFVLDLYTKHYIQKVESVQRRAVRFITNDYGRESSVTNVPANVLTNLELHFFHKDVSTRLTMMHKIVQNKSRSTSV